MVYSFFFIFFFLHFYKTQKHKNSIMHSLRSLVLGGRNITDFTLKAVVPDCPNLQFLHLYSCNKVTDSGVAAVVRYW